MERLAKTPALKIDAEIARIRREPLNLTLDQKLERRIVATLCAHMRAAGWDVVNVWDGEETHAAHTALEAMEVVFNLDESMLRFRKITPSGTHVHAVYLVTGNGCDIISDWHFTEGDEDGFSALMDRFLDKYRDAIDAADERAHDERLKREREKRSEYAQQREYREQNPEADFQLYDHDAADRVAFESEKIERMRSER